MKRKISILLVLLVLSCSVKAYADESVTTGEFFLLQKNECDVFNTIEEITQDSLKVPAKSTVLMELTTGKVLYCYNENTRSAPASVTKIMTLILTFEALEQGKFALNDMVTPSAHACSMGGSQIWLKPDEQMSVQDLIKATAVASANDAAVALGELVAGTEESFVTMMNQKAAELGLKNTSFKNATGLDAADHYTTALDIAVMSRYLLQNYPQICDYSTIWMDSLRSGATQLVNTNKLVRFYDGCIGLKTGTTSGAGYCLSAAAKRNDMTLIAVVMGGETSQLRFDAARSLLDTGFAKYEINKVPVPKLAPLSLPVKYGASSHVKLDYTTGGSVLTAKGEGANLKAAVTLKQDVSAPVSLGEIVGYVDISCNDTLIKQYPITAAHEVKRLSFLKALQLLAEFTVNFA